MRGVRPEKHHGHASGGDKSSTYYTWQSMRQRCNNPRHPSWSYYGGRGIRVCARWDSFANFLADMGDRPEGRTLERKNNAGDYEPGNCVWATPTEQALNRRARSSDPLYDGKTAREWATEWGISRRAAKYRLTKT